MKHYGDICELSGYELPEVDCLIGGSPCQDISIAGKKAGIIEGERSNLFFKQLRIVKEMREKTNGRKPRYMVWENVPAILGADKGEQFRKVLQEIIKVAEPEAPDLPLPKKGRWPNSGCLYDELGRWSISYRIFDAQFWGVPQRRKRIALVVDYRGRSAPEILFERKGNTWDPQESEEEEQEAAGTAEESTDASVWCLQGNGIGRADTAGCEGKGFQPDISYTLNTMDRHAVAVDLGGLPSKDPFLIEMTSTKNTIVKDGICPTLTARMGTGGNQVNAIFKPE